MNAQAVGGFCPPGALLTVPAELVDKVHLTPMRDAIMALPRFTALRGGISFEEPAVRWARERERELRRYARMWDWQ